MEDSEDIADYKPGGYHPLKQGEILYNRYEIVQKIGFGYFATVWLALDRHSLSYVALKIQKSALNFTDAAMDEIDILTKLYRNCGNPKWTRGENVHILKILNHFMHKGPNGNHVCMIFEILGVNLVEIMKFFGFKGVRLDLCKRILTQSLIALDFLHRICGVIHTDIKPENILIELNDSQKNALTQRQQYLKVVPVLKVTKKVTVKIEKKYFDPESFHSKNKKRTEKKIIAEKRKEKRKKRRGIKDEEFKEIVTEEEVIDPNFSVKLIDFGNSCWTHKHFADVIQTLHYRSPEVVLGINYSHSADLWSLGCVFFELLTGNYFMEIADGTQAEIEMLARVQSFYHGKIFEWAVKGRFAKKFLNENGSLKNTETKVTSFEEMLNRRAIEGEQAQSISELLRMMLNPNPHKRASAFECLNHPWLK